MIKNNNQLFIIELVFMMIFHFLADFCGVYTFYHSFQENTFVLAYAIIGYNVLAFGLQPIFGFIVDKFPKYKNILVMIAMIFIFVGALYIFDAYFSMAFMGVGNALFHVSGSKDILTKAKGKLPLGLYIAPGVLGLGIGYTFYSVDGFVYMFYVALGLIFLYMIFHLMLIEDTFYVLETNYKPSKLKSNYSIIFLVLVSVSLIFRGGLTNSTPSFEAIRNFYLYCCLAAFGGKLLGGFLPNKISIGVSILMTLLSMIFITNEYGVIFFNLGISILMPLTLNYLRKTLFKYEATALGISSLMLLIGNIGFGLADDELKIILLIIGYILFVIVMVLISVYEFPAIRKKLKLNQSSEKESKIKEVEVIEEEEKTSTESN